MNSESDPGSTLQQWKPVRNYPVAENWYKRLDLDHGVTRIWEPHVHPLEQANFWHVRGRDKDLLIDSGDGHCSTTFQLPGFVRRKGDHSAWRPTRILITSARYMNSENRWVHSAEARQMEHPSGVVTLICSDIKPALCKLFVEAGYPPLEELLIDALPHADYNPREYYLRGAVPTRIVAENDIIDLGDRCLEILHTPGHSPGSICLWEESTGTLYTGDVIYDGPLVYEGPGMDLKVYAQSLRRLKQLPVRVVHAGHDPSFDRERLIQIVDSYLKRWNS